MKKKIEALFIAIFTFMFIPPSHAKKTTSSCQHDKIQDYLQEKKYDLAIAECNKAIELAPNDARNYLVRGKTYAQQEKYTEAISDFSKVVELTAEPGRSYFREVLGEAYHDNGLFLLKKNLYDQAISHYTEAIKLK